MPCSASIARSARRLIGFSLLLLGLSVGCAHAAARHPQTARLAAADPAHNLPVQIPSACQGAGAGASETCEQLAVALLDRGRAQEDLGPYRLPRDFASLSGAEQILVLADLDRAARGLPVVPGMTNVLNGTAMRGIRNDTDPEPASMAGLDAFTANWANGYPDAIWAYLSWMYDDGPGSSNLDCSHAGASGCWGHRHDILFAFPGTGALAMGTADAAGSDTMIIVQRQSPTPPAYAFTFAAARAQGAGRLDGSLAVR